MSLVRGACPGLSDPMPTGDGLLVRLTPNRQVDPAAFVALCALARQHGNGVMEITPRGNIQVRGLTPQSAPLFADAIAALRIASMARVPVLTDPLPEDPDVSIDAAAIADALTETLQQRRPVPGSEIGQILAALAQWRHAQPRRRVEAHVEIGAEASLAHERLDVLVRRRDELGRRGPRTRVPEARHRAAVEQVDVAAQFVALGVIGGIPGGDGEVGRPPGQRSAAERPHGAGHRLDDVVGERLLRAVGTDPPEYSRVR